MPQLLKLSREELRELQLKELDALIYFKEFCEENDLIFYLCGGCLIGALRNKGFIPWDDDIDVYMPRNDYEQLERLWKENNKNDHFKLLRTNDEVFTGNIFMTLVDTNYTCVKANQVGLDIPHGLVLDIFPIDACPDKKIQRFSQLFWTLIYSLFLAQVVPENHGGAVAFGSKVLLEIFKSKKTRNKIWRYAQKQMTKYDIDECDNVSDLCAGPISMLAKYPKQLFDKTVYIEFEGTKMPIMEGYDEYLKIAFGDYMKIPPEEDCVPHHDLVELDLTKPCI